MPLASISSHVATILASNSAAPLPVGNFAPLALACAENAIVWGGNYFADVLPPTMGWLVWNKMQRDFSLSDGELAWTSYEKALRICDISRGKALTDGKEHPTQKSLDLMRWCIDYADRAGAFRACVGRFKVDGGEYGAPQERFLRASP